jgi:hypothetical protein
MGMIRAVVIVGVVILLLALNAREFVAKRAAASRDFAGVARAQALQGLAIEQLLHMILNVLAAILAALLWR